MKNTLLTILSLSVMLLACAGGDRDAVLELEAEVLQLHDEVMPQLDDIMSLKGMLAARIQKADSLENEGISGNNLAEERMKASDLNQRLSQADKAMMDWMNNYRGDSALKLKNDQAILYFHGEKKKLEAIKEQTVKSIQDAKTFLN